MATQQHAASTDSAGSVRNPPHRSFYVATERAPLGKGSFGTVYRGVDQATCEAVAVKLIIKKKLKSGDLESCQQEGKMMRKIGAHPNILRLVDKGEDAKHIYLVTPIIAGGSLKQLVRGDGAPYDDETAKKLLRRLLSGIAHMHSRGVMHRDIKLDNILMRPSKDETKLPTDPVLMDFGFATDVARPNVFCGTIYYVAPEVIGAGQSRDYSVYYDSKCDVWSFGVVAYMLLQQGDRPFTGANVRDCCKAISRGSPAFNRPISDEARAFIEHLLVVAPRKRPTAAQAMNHPFLSNNASSMFGDRSALLKSLARSAHDTDFDMPLPCETVSDRASAESALPACDPDISVQSASDASPRAYLPAVEAISGSYQVDATSDTRSTSRNSRRHDA